ncbi:hypothetical protein ACTNEU_10250 [Ellagibacter isourolithinifaciens]|uniref:hypothetical protein n=1 Tax=Ellagibacter isourolithinifaciens TaxID=2137581 RepID=UPI003F8C5426
MTTTWSEMRSYATATADHTAASYGAARAYCAALFDGDEIETTRDMLNRIRREQRVASQALTKLRRMLDRPLICVRHWEVASGSSPR